MTFHAFQVWHTDADIYCVYSIFINVNSPHSHTQLVFSSSLIWPLPQHGCEAGHICDVMMNDSLLTLCCPSVSSADTNTSYLFQLRPALLSRAIDKGLCNMLVKRHQTIFISGGVCMCWCACVFRLGYVNVLQSGICSPYRQFAYKVLTQVELFNVLTLDRLPF